MNSSRLVAKIRDARPLYDLAARHLGRADARRALCRVEQGRLGRGRSGDARPGTAVWEIGLPAAYSPQGAAVTLLFTQSVAAMSDEAIRQTLSGGVYMDAETLDVLNRRGFGESDRPDRRAGTARGLHRGTDRPSAQRSFRRSPTRLPAVVLPCARAMC